MIVSRTPFRISFVGGGSDLPSFYTRSSGAVLSTTINRYMYISSHDFFDNSKIRLKYSKTETVDNPRSIKHPIFREVLSDYRLKGIEISSNADIPAKTGLGSSSSFTVGLLHNLNTKNGKFVSREQLAEKACEIEINKLGDPIGKQDQYAASFGGLNTIEFEENSVRVTPIHLKKSVYKELQNNMLMFYTGGQRSSSHVLKDQSENMSNIDSFKNVEEMVDLVWDLRDSLYNGDLTNFGEILDKNWNLKKRLSGRITNNSIDSLYNRGIKNGALGGKLLGAGGGGFLLFYCEADKKKRIREAFRKYTELNFKFDNEGSKIIHASDEYTGSIS